MDQEQILEEHLIKFICADLKLVTGTKKNNNFYSLSRIIKNLT